MSRGITKIVQSFIFLALFVTSTCLMAAALPLDTNYFHYYGRYRGFTSWFGQHLPWGWILGDSFMRALSLPVMAWLMVWLLRDSAARLKPE